MSEAHTVTIRILDKEYRITCPEEESTNLENAALYLGEKMREIRATGKVIGADRIAVMAALNITHELLHRQQRLERQAEQSRERIKELLDQVDLALDKNLPPQTNE